MAKQKVGLIGAGFAAMNHVDALSRIRDVEIVAIADFSAESAARAAAKAAIPRAYGDYRALIADPDVAVIHNCTPNHLHAEVNQAVLEAGKHLLSEKPLATTSAETAALLRLARAKEAEGVVSGVCFNYRHYPLVRQVKELLAGGEYGAPHLITGSYLQDWLLYETDWNWRLETERNGLSRAIADIGSHWADLIQFITGDRIVSVSADLSTLYPTRWRPTGEVQTFASGSREGRAPVDVSTEDFGSVTFHTAGGIRGAFTVSQVSAGRKNRLSFEIDAAKAAFAWDQEEPNRLWIGRRDGANSQLMRDGSLLHPEAARLARMPGGHEEGWPDGLKNLFADFYGAIDAAREGRSYPRSVASFADGHQIMQLVEAILESHRTRRWVDLEPAQEV